MFLQYFYHVFVAALIVLCHLPEWCSLNFFLCNPILRFAGKPPTQASSNSSEKTSSIFNYHRLCSSSSTVVMTTSKVNGKMEILTPCRSETPENIETKTGKNDYVMGPFNPANFRGNRYKVVCTPYSWNITLNCLIPSLSFFFLSSPTAKTGGQIFMICTSNDTASPKNVSFKGFDEKTKLFRVSKPHKTPKSGRG